MSKGLRKGLYPWRSQIIGSSVLAAAWLARPIDPWYATVGEVVLGLLLVVGRPWYWAARGRHGARAAIGRAERKQERSDGVQSRWDHMRHSSRTAMRVRWAKSLQAERTDLGGLIGWWKVFTEPVDAYATAVLKTSYGWKYLPHNSITTRIAAARSGKSVALADRILRHPGPVVATSTRTDLVEMTAELRAMGRGPVYFFNAGQVGNIVSTLKWSVLSGCKEMGTAQRRARDLVGPVKEGSDSARWDNKAIDILGPLMYVAASHGLSMRTIASWVGEAGGDDKEGTWEQIQYLLRQTDDGRLAEELLKQFFLTNPRTLTSITSSMTPALAWLSNSATAELGDSEDVDFDIERELIDADATIYILGRRGNGVGNLTGALVAEIMEVARSVASRRPGGRLSPALLLALDELALTVPGPVHEWVLDMGGFGITGDFCIQQRASLDEIWGVNGRNVILGNSLTVMFGAGCNQSDVANDFSLLSGTRTEQRRSYDASGRHTSSSEVEVNVVDPGKLMNLQIGDAIWFSRGRIDEGKMLRADTRRDVRRIKKARNKVNGRIAAQVEEKPRPRKSSSYKGQEEAERWYAETMQDLEDNR